jgi:methyl-accepting chemotaxis protein
MINRSLGEISDLIVETKPSVKQTMASVQRTAEILETGIAGPIASELNLANTAGLLTQIHSAFDRLNQSLDDATVLTGKAKNLVVLNSHRFSQLMQNLTETSDHLKNAGKDLRRNPWRLFYRPSLDETKQLNIFDAAREFSGAAARLDDSATQLAALMESRDEAVASDDPDLIEIKERLKKTFDDYTRTEEALWNLLNTP